MNIHKVIKQISLIILLQIFYKASSSSSFDYPYSISLVNDTILLIQKTGIGIYDNSLNKLSQIIEFKEEEEITEEDFSKIIIKNNKQNILSIISDKLYIFNNEGKLLYKSEEKINNNQTIYSYSLTFTNVYKDGFNFVIGYFNEDSYLNLSIYKYYNETKKLKLENKHKYNSFSYKIPNEYKYGIFNFTQEQKLLTCEYMLARTMQDYAKILVCFFNSNTTVGVMAFYLEYSSITNYLTLLNHSLFISTQDIENNTNITSIKSEVNNYGTTVAIVWLNFKGENQTRYFIYDISYMLHMLNYYQVYKNLLQDFYTRKMPTTCIQTEYEKRINLFPYKNQIAFSCIIEDNNIEIVLINTTNFMNDTYIINTTCINNNEISKLYYNDNNNYLIYPCLKNCSDKILDFDIDCINMKREDERKRIEKYKKTKKIMKIIAIILIIVFIILVLIFIIAKYLKSKNFEYNWKRGKADDKAMENILEDLLPENNQ